MRHISTFPGCGAAWSKAERCTADPGPRPGIWTPGLQRTASRCTAPGEHFEGRASSRALSNRHVFGAPDQAHRRALARHHVAGILADDDERAGRRVDLIKPMGALEHARTHGTGKARAAPVCPH